MKRLLLLLVVVACAQPRPQQPPPPQPVAATTVVEYEEHGELPPGAGVSVVRDQPAHVKLKLGHFRNDAAGIGVTIDLLSAATENVADIDPAKLRFDGEERVWLLEGRHGSNGRTDYVRDGERVMLQVSRGHFVVYVPDPETDRASDAISVFRDGDADPL